MGDELDILHVPLYSYAESDHLAGVTRGTSKRWIDGYEYWSADGNRIVLPPVTLVEYEHNGISFLDLIEIRAIGNLKAAGFSLRNIRDIALTCQQMFGETHPLVTLRFRTAGPDIFVPSNGSLIEVGKKKGQHAWKEFLAPFLQDVEYEHEMARRWYPLGKANLVVVDPDYGFGLPVTRNSGVRREIIQERFQVGDSVDQIAQDFNMHRDEVEQALRFESKLATKAA